MSVLHPTHYNTLSCPPHSSTLTCNEGSSSKSVDSFDREKRQFHEKYVKWDHPTHSTTLSCNAENSKKKQPEDLTTTNQDNEEKKNTTSRRRANRKRRAKQLANTGASQVNGNLQVSLHPPAENDNKPVNSEPTDGLPQGSVISRPLFIEYSCKETSSRVYADDIRGEHNNWLFKKMY